MGGGFGRWFGATVTHRSVGNFGHGGIGFDDVAVDDDGGRGGIDFFGGLDGHFWWCVRSC